MRSLEVIRKCNRDHKARCKSKIVASNLLEVQGLPPDPWVVNFRKKGNEGALRRKKAYREANPLPNKVPKVKTKRKRVIIGPTIDRATYKKLTIEEKAISLISSKAKAKKYRQDNRERFNKAARERKQNYPEIRIKANLRKRLSTLVRLRLGRKTTQTMKALGCDFDFFLKHLENRFTTGMTFENYGLWHVDHIIPCDVFDLTIKEEIEKCFHYTNLQPLWAKDNREKSNKILRVA